LTRVARGGVEIEDVRLYLQEQGYVDFSREDYVARLTPKGAALLRRINGR